MTSLTPTQGKQEEYWTRKDVVKEIVHLQRCKTTTHMTVWLPRSVGQYFYKTRQGAVVCVPSRATWAPPSTARTRCRSSGTGHVTGCCSWCTRRRTRRRRRGVSSSRLSGGWSWRELWLIRVVGTRPSAAWRVFSWGCAGSGGGRARRGDSEALAAIYGRIVYMYRDVKQLQTIYVKKLEKSRP